MRCVKLNLKTRICIRDPEKSKTAGAEPKTTPTTATKKINQSTFREGGKKGMLESNGKRQSFWWKKEFHACLGGLLSGSSAPPPLLSSESCSVVCWDKLRGVCKGAGCESSPHTCTDPCWLKYSTKTVTVPFLSLLAFPSCPGKPTRLSPPWLQLRPFNHKSGHTN